MNDVEEKVINIIKSILDITEDINKNASIRDFGINSIVLIQILVNIEAEFNIEYSDEALSSDTMSTIQNIVESVENLLNK